MSVIDVVSGWFRLVLSYNVPFVATKLNFLFHFVKILASYIP